MFDHDEEMPRGFTDADIEQAQFEDEGRRLAARIKRGICSHGWRLGKGSGAFNAGADEIARDRQRGHFPDRPTDPRVTDQASIPAGMDLCLDCGGLVESWGF